MIKRELAIFLVVGVTTVLVDFISYRSLTGLANVPVDLAKAIGFALGTVFSYFANRFWTFAHQPHGPGSVWRFALLYASTLATNVLINALALRVLADSMAAVPVAFVVATAVSACLNFLGMKFFVFRPAPAPELQ